MTTSLPNGSFNASVLRDTAYVAKPINAQLLTRVLADLALGSLLAACQVGTAAGGSDPTSGVLPAAPAEAVDRGPVIPDAAVDPCAGPEPSDRRGQVCRRWRCDGAGALDPARWEGAPASCAAGDLDAIAGARALRLLNRHRFLAHVEPLAVEPSWTGAAQACALIAHANGVLSHEPPPTWRCWSADGALASSLSLIANRSVAVAIDAFIEDPGNEGGMAHRRWLLSEELRSVGFGSTDRYACVVVDGGRLDQAGDLPAKPPPPAAPRGWVAWPPDGPVPSEVFESERLDEAGWTVQSSGADLELASVVVTASGARAPLPILVFHLTPGLGSRSAIRFVPVGWRATVGTRYTVEVHGALPFAYTVEPVDC